jgi:UDP-N-acetylglucosamine 2-epimerase
MKKIAIIYGTRPQIIKVNMLVKQFEKHADEYRLVLIDTGQHYSPELAGNIYKELGLRKPDYQLDVNGDPAIDIGHLIIQCAVKLENERPDLVCVIGDTNSTLAGAIAAKRSGFKLAHIEAGLRSHDNSMPEEQNRILADTMADLRFHIKLRSTNDPGFYKNRGDIEVGDLMEESYWYYSEKPHGGAVEYWLNKMKEAPINLMTIHREENTSRERLTEIVSAIGFLSQSTIWPVHPRISNLPYFEEIKKLAPRILYAEPLGYLQTICILNTCRAVLTDSGGLYREAVWANKPVVVIRTSTEFNASRLVDFVTREAIVTKYYEVMLDYSKVGVGYVSTPPSKPTSEWILQAIGEYLHS